MKKQQPVERISSSSKASPVTRRSVLKATAASFIGYRFAGDAATLDASPSESKTRSGYQQPHVAVIGAGGFGGWTALNLLRKGAKVTLLDTWGPGNARASSGCERRMIHSQLYAVGSTGSNKEVYRPLYMDMITRALQLWRENEERWKRQLYFPCGSLTLQPEDAPNGREALAYMRERGTAVEELSLQELESRYPQINLEGVSWGLLDVDSGYLRSRVACQEVFRGFLEEGGEYRQVAVKAPEIEGGGLDSLSLSDGSQLSADNYIFACGPWLGQMFPGTIRIRASRQEAFFFGTPVNDHRYDDKHLPICLDGTRSPSAAVLPDGDFRGLLVEGGPPRVRIINPTTEDRGPTPELLAFHREYLAFRFPGMKDAPLLSMRVCQYENSDDQNFVIDRHPEAENVWLVGGGSGHGFKHAPVIGEWTADMVFGDKAVEPLFGLQRFRRRRAV